MNKKYIDIVNTCSVHENRFKNMIISFVFGGMMGVINELLIKLFMILEFSSSDSKIMSMICFIFISSLLTGFGVMDNLINFFKCSLIVPITGFAHSITSSMMEYRKEGMVLGIGSNAFKLAGSVILYGVVSAYFVGLIKILFMGV